MSRFKQTTLYLVLVLLTALMLIGINGVEKQMDKQVKEYRLRFTGDIKNASPLVSFTTMALGSFRGIVADMLWLRAESLKQDGKYFELIQLGRWIVDLQPNFTGATAYLAWNMAYNISVTCTDHAERWKWVNEGIKLIRDQALEYNPDDPDLYYELAWIYKHKVGDVMDDANMYYKTRLALEMREIMGENFPDWKALAEVPADLKELEKVYPADHEVWRQIKAAGYPDIDALYKQFSQAAPAALPAELAAKLTDDKVRRDFYDYLRCRLLRDRLKLDPREIVEIENTYGKLDWRVPESFAIYWAARGNRRAPNGRSIKCDRIIAQSLYTAFKSGRLLMIDPDTFEGVQIAPNLDLVDAVDRTFADANEYYTKLAGGERGGSTFRTARINFLKEAVTLLYNYGKFAKAKEYFAKLIKEDGPKPNLETFILNEWSRQVKQADVKTANAIISGLIYQSVYYLLYDEMDAALAQERLAQAVYRNYMREFGDSERTRLAPYQNTKRNVVDNCLRTLPPLLAQMLRARITSEQVETEQQQKFTSPSMSGLPGSSSIPALPTDGKDDK